jgi:hypothetical protein
MTSTKSVFPRLLVLVAAVLLVGAGCAPTAPEQAVVSETTEPLPPTSEVAPSEAAPAPTSPAAEDPAGQWTEYQNENFQFRFAYPSDWFGPDVYESDGSLRLAVGSDVVYPYGTSREDQINTLPDAYFITIQYNQNQSNLTWDDYVNSGWITSYLELRDLGEGESYSTARSLSIKVRDITLGRFQGLEYIFTLPDTAQTERVYGRQIVAFDQDLNMLQIMGQPNLVTISDESSWKTDYQRVDESYQEVFRSLAESITGE